MDDLLARVVDAVTDICSPVYLVGGAVRDHLMGRGVKDYDFTTPLIPDVIEEAIRTNNPGRHLHTVGKRFGTLGTKVYIPSFEEYVEVEITTFREETYSGSRKPEVTFVTNISEDLGRRDFTFNAIAMRKDKGYRLIDPYNGKDDIEAGVIRAVGNARARFKEDPLRMLRAARFCSTLGFSIEEITMARMTSGSIQILGISKERWTQELDKLLMGDNVVQALYVLMESGLMRWMVPELYMQYKYDQKTPHHDFDLWEHTCRVVAACPKDLNLRYAALFHDVGKPFTMTQKASGQQNYVGHELMGYELIKKIGHYLKWSNDRLTEVSELVKGHLEETNILRAFDCGAQKRSE
jgi:tRNA nucleotidyltransferase (CCA-adding enzyme)